MNKKVLIAWIILLLVCISGIAVFFLMKHIPHDSPAARIYSDGQLIRTVFLSEDCEFTVTTDSGYNTVRVADGCISICAADCPDKVCVNSGSICSGTVPIICLPHRLEIRVVSGGGDIDAVVQ